MREVLVMITTVSNEEIARNISNSLIEKKLAACISLKKISSIYKWGGDIEEAEEIEITIKSKLELKDNLIEALQKMTTYEVPQILYKKFQSDSKYYDWLKSSF